MDCRVWCTLVALAWLGWCHGAALVLVGLQPHIDSVSFGTLNLKSGVSQVKSAFLELVVEPNAEQFAYSPSNQHYTFIAYDISPYTPILITLNASSGHVIYKSSFASPPYPFGLHYDTVLSQLFAQLWYPNGTASMVIVDPQTLSTRNTGFYFQADNLWTSAASTYDEHTHTYYALYVSAWSETLIGVTTLNGLVTLNVTIRLNNTVNAYGLQYNNNTNTFYVIGLNRNTQSFDVGVIDQATGNLQFLNLFANASFGGDVLGMGLDKADNLLSLVYQSSNGTDLVLTNIDLKARQIIGTLPISRGSVSVMLDFAML